MSNEDEKKQPAVEEQSENQPEEITEEDLKGVAGGALFGQVVYHNMPRLSE